MNFAAALRMSQHDVVDIGASSGGVEALTTLMAGLPANLAAAIFVVLHVPPEGPSMLPTLLNRAGRMPAAHAVDEEPIRRGRIYVAPPAHQMYVQAGRIAVRHGPRENLHRPAVDPLFRTAAHHYGTRVIGVVLSGMMDDGTAGLLAVKDAGGLTVVQDPDDAVCPDMPASAFEAVQPDYSVPVGDLAELLVHLVGADAASESLAREVPLETVEEAELPSDALTSAEQGETSAFTCPECHGTLWQISDGRTLRYRCRVGHAFSEETMVSAQGESTERALWAALRSLEERYGMLTKLADRARARGHDAIAEMFAGKSRQVESDVCALHELIVGGILQPAGEDKS